MIHGACGGEPAAIEGKVYATQTSDRQGLDELTGDSVPDLGSPLFQRSQGPGRHPAAIGTDGTGTDIALGCKDHALLRLVKMQNRRSRMEFGIATTRPSPLCPQRSCTLDSASRCGGPILSSPRSIGSVRTGQCRSPFSP